MVSSSKFQLGWLNVWHVARLLLRVELVSCLLAHLDDVLLLGRLQLTLARIGATRSLELLARSRSQEDCILLSLLVTHLLLVEHHSSCPRLLEALVLILRAHSTCHGRILKSSSSVKHVLGLQRRLLTRFHHRRHINSLHVSISVGLWLRHVLALRLGPLLLQIELFVSPSLLTGSSIVLSVLQGGLLRLRFCFLLAHL